MVSRVVALLGVALVIAGCVARETPKSSAFVEGTSVHTISVGGHDRSYRLYKPAGLPASASLIVMLHGGFGSGKQPKSLTAGMDWRTRPSSSSPIRMA